MGHSGCAAYLEGAISTENHECMATWWMHWPDLQWPDADDLDKIKARAEGFANAGVVGQGTVAW